MAEFPAGICQLIAGYSDDFDPSVERTEMERGVPKQRVLNAHVMAKISCVLLFKSSADAEAFETWYFDTIKRIGWFNVVHPRRGVTVSARFEGGKLGALSPVSSTRKQWRRDVVLEYLR